VRAGARWGKWWSCLAVSEMLFEGEKAAAKSSGGGGEIAPPPLPKETAVEADDEGEGDGAGDAASLALGDPGK